MYMPFVPVVMDEFAPIAYSNFADVLRKPRAGSDAALSVCHAGALPQLLTVSEAFEHDVASAPDTTSCSARATKIPRSTSASFCPGAADPSWHERPQDRNLNARLRRSGCR